MLKVKVKRGHIKIEKFVPEQLVRAKRIWQKQAPKIIVDEMKQAIERGNSPVTGAGRFEVYSVPYKDAIKAGRYKRYKKRIRPVNLTLTGRMMKSLIYRKTIEGFVVYFTNPLASIHSKDGAGKSKTIRKVIPQKGEKLKRSITYGAMNLLEKLIRSFT